MFHTTYRVPQGEASPRARTATSPATRRPALGFLTASKLAKRDAVLRLVPDHAGLGHPPPAVRATRTSASGPSRPRTRSRRSARRSARPTAARSALTGTSGPGIALKPEAIGLAVMTELPLVVIDVQRAGPSTGLPTKTEQADLLQVLYGRNGESPDPDRRPGDARRVLLAGDRGGPDRAQVHDAGRLPVRRVHRQRRGAVAGARRSTTLPDISVEQRRQARSGPFLPYDRDPETLGRPWAIPGTPGLEHRIGGLEKADGLGNVSYDPENHHKMTLLPGAEGGRHRPRHPAARDVRARRGRAAGPRLGRHLRRDPERGRAAAGRGHAAWPTPTCAT